MSYPLVVSCLLEDLRRLYGQKYSGSQKLYFVRRDCPSSGGDPHLLLTAEEFGRRAAALVGEDIEVFGYEGASEEFRKAFAAVMRDCGSGKKQIKSVHDVDILLWKYIQGMEKGEKKK